MTLTSDSSAPVDVGAAQDRAPAQKRFALVIGINKYQNVPELQTAVNDAGSMKLALAELGFEVHEGINPGRQDMVSLIDAFRAQVGPGDVVFFFFAGHGVEISNRNYLLPADVPLAYEGQDGLICDSSIPADVVIDRFLDKGAQLVIAALDACRDNPLERPGGRSLKLGRGLAPMERDDGDGVFIIFSAGARHKALDRLYEGDTDPNSVFTRVFLPHLKQRGHSLVDLIKNVQEEVRHLASTVKYVQKPAYYDGVAGHVYLAGDAQQAEIEQFQEFDLAPTMVVIPRGNMTCGARAGEPAALSHEYPQHLVQIAKPFALGQSPVTVAEWQAYALEKGLNCPTGTAQAPVVNVSWYEARAYAEWLTEKTGHRYRLPTEAEWEYAVRAGRAGTLYAWGDRTTIASDFAHYGRTKTDVARVELLKPNGFGLYDMHGNVWEWVADSYVDAYQSGPSDGSAVERDEMEDRRGVVRGGCWASPVEDLRCASRRDWYKTGGARHIGFRVARDAAEMPHTVTKLSSPAASLPAASLPAAAPLRSAQGPTKRRTALVIGNGNYQNAATLENPCRDAEAVAKALRRVGFDSVTLVTELNKQKMSEAIRSFARDAKTAAWAMIYFAGHGIEIGGVNYLLPIDTKLETDRDVEFEAIPLDHVVSAVERADSLRFVVLDACRNNPFVRNMRLTSATRSIVGSGLGSVAPDGGILILYAAKHGHTAIDGEGLPNSPFAAALVENLVQPGIDIWRLVGRVRDSVLKATNEAQQPYWYGSLPDKPFYFVQFAELLHTDNQDI